MRKMMTSLLVSTVFLMLGGCTRKPLFLRMPTTGLEVTVNTRINTDITTDILWGASWDADMLYKWNTDLYGNLGYTEPREATGWFMEKINTKSTTVPRFLLFTKDFHKGQDTKVNMVIDVSHDILFHTDIKNSEMKLQSDHSRFDIVSLPDYDDVFDFEGEGFTPMKQPGEIFSVYIDDINLKRDYPDVQPFDDDGELIYVYQLNAKLVPVTYIYIIQIVIVDDNGKYPDVDSISMITMSGMAASRNLLYQKAGKDRCDITARDIYPGQQLGDSTVYMARMLSFGAPYATDYDDISWVIVDDARFKLGANIVMQDGTVKRLLADITPFINRHPTGGIYTICINRSELQKNNAGGGFDITVEDWTTEVEVEIQI